MKILFTGIVLAAVASAAAFGDVIQLKDGRKLSGSFTRQGDIITIKTDDGKVLQVGAADVTGVTLTNTVTPEEAATAAWAKVLLQIKAADDMQAVLDLHQKYLAQTPAPLNAAEVRASLALYEKLQSTHAVKFRGRWVPQAQIEVLLRTWTDAARPAADAYRAGKMKDALDEAKKAIDADDQNPDALTIAGLASYRTGAIAQARKYFTQLAAADPGSVLAENNLAVVCFLQKQSGEGLGHYLKALQLMPDQRVVLDNALEAVRAFVDGGGDKSANVLKTLQRQLDVSQKAVDAAMAKQGLTRWGNSWVNKDQVERLGQAKGAIKAQMALLDAQYQTLKDAGAKLEAGVVQAKKDYDSAMDLILLCNSQLVAIQRGGGDLGFVLANRDGAIQAATQSATYQTQAVAQMEQIAVTMKLIEPQAQRLKAAMGAVDTTKPGEQRVLDLGEVENPPAVVPLGEVDLNAMLPAAIQMPPLAPPVMPALVTIPEPFVINGGGGGGGGGRRGGGGGGGGPGTQPGTRPATQPGT